MINADQLKRISTRSWFYPLALLVIGFITYNYVLTSLGYYWADWEIVMFMKLNPALKFNFYIHDRPFPWTYQLIQFLVGTNPFGWHIVTLLIRWAGVLFFVKAVTLVWPRYKQHFLWLGVLLLVYPGFLQQSQSATKARHIMTFLLFALSLYLMALAVKRPKWARILFPLSWLATFAHLFTTEYFAALELMRPILLWLLMKADNPRDARVLPRVVINSLPYLILTLFWAWCRFIYFPVIFQTTSRIGDIDRSLGKFQGSFFGSLLDLFNRVFLDFLYSTVQVWTNAIIRFDGFTFQNKVAWFAFGLGLVLALAFAFFHDTKEDDVVDSSSPASIFMIGLMSFVLGALPAWAIGKDLSTGGWNDRFSLAPMIGAGLMVMALFLWFVRPNGQKLILGVMLAFSIATQVWVVNVYRQDWRTQREYYWQLYWRVPALQSGTAIFSFEQPSPTVTEYSDGGYVHNILYNYKSEDGVLPYWYLSRWANFELNKPIEYEIRTLKFEGNTSESIALLHPLGACLRILDPVYTFDPLYDNGQEVLIPLSNTSRIIPDPDAALPDANIFGGEPRRDWCYFFEKADLARQVKDWDTAIQLYKQAQQNGFTAENGAEYIPFMEAYAQKGDWQKAYDVTMKAKATSQGLNRMLCLNWTRLSELPSPDTGVVEQVKQDLGCSNY